MDILTLRIALVMYAFWGLKLVSVYLLVFALILSGHRLMTDSNEEDK